MRGGCGAGAILAKSLILVWEVKDTTRRCWLVLPRSGAGAGRRRGRWGRY